MIMTWYDDDDDDDSDEDDNDVVVHVMDGRAEQVASPTPSNLHDLYSMYTLYIH